MRTVNKVILVGNVTRDALWKETTNWKKVLLFTIATNRYYKDAQWEQQSEAEFSNCVAWWALAERYEQYVTKWKLVYVEGHLKTRAIEKENGEKYYRTEIVVNNLIFLNRKEVSSGSKDEFADLSGSF